MLSAVGNSFFLVAASEWGDKTQLLAAALSVRYGRPGRMLAAATAATFTNHLLSAQIGQWVGAYLNGHDLALIVTCLFGAIAIATLVSAAKPGHHSIPETREALGPGKIFLLFFLAEMGDKTQLTTATLAAQYHSVFLVATSSALGTLVPDGIAIYLGSKVHRWIHWKRLKWISAATFAGFAIHSAMSL